MAKQYMPLKDGSEAAVLGGEIPQLRPLVFSDDSKYTTFSYTYYPEGLEISDSYTYDPGGSEISETVAREIATFDVLPTNYPGGLEISEAVVPNISTRLYAIKATIDFSKAKGDLQGVLMAQGGCFGGHGFYIYQGKLCYVYNWLGQPEKIACDLPRLSSEAEVLNVKILRILSKLCIGIDDTKFEQLMTLFSINKGFYLGETQTL